MKPTPSKILLTGAPGCGKTTLLRRVLDSFPGPAYGFFTLEIREQGQRVGFEMVTLDGARGMLAHRDFTFPQRVGRYSVDCAAIDRIAVPAIERGLEIGGLLVIDEIGPMELFSARFQQVVEQALSCRAPLLGTIVQRSFPFTDRIKRLPQVALIEVTPLNRDRLFAAVFQTLTGLPSPTAD